MKYNDIELDELLERLVASTRSPRGKFSAETSYPLLEKRLAAARRKRLLPKRIFATAATLALLCLSAWMAYTYLLPVHMQTVSTLSKTQNVELPDGTCVTLNRFSSLTYPERFRSGERKVTLRGEAYFEVAKKKKQPFIVQAEAVQVKVLGTHFNIDAYPGNPDIRTTLFEGSVAVSEPGVLAPLILKPNEMAIYNKVEKTLQRKNMQNATEEIAWRKGEFVFTHLPLQDIARELSNSFGVTIHIPDTALQNYHITARFPGNENLETILSLLQKAGYFNYSQNNKEIILTTKPDLK